MNWNYMTPYPEMWLFKILTKHKLATFERKHIKLWMLFQIKINKKEIIKSHIKCFSNNVHTYEENKRTHTGCDAHNWSLLWKWRLYETNLRLFSPHFTEIGRRCFNLFTERSLPVGYRRTIYMHRFYIWRLGINKKRVTAPSERIYLKMSGGKKWWNEMSVKSRCAFNVWFTA